VGYVDMALTGHILKTEAHIAAMGTLAYLMWFLVSLFAAAAIGATAVVARCVGEGKPQLAALASNQALLLSMVIAVPATLLCVFGGTQLAEQLALQGTAAELAGRYLLVFAWSVPLIAIQRVGIASLRGAGDTISGLVAMTLVNVVNLVLGLALVTGWGPFPNLGWDGLALGAAIGNAVGGLIILGCLVAGRAGLPLRADQLRPHGEMLRRLWRIGLPGGIDTMAILFCHLWYLRIINSVGLLDAAAHGLGVRIESLAYLPGSAFQVAAGTMAGQFLGAGDPQRARHGVWLAVWWGGGIMSLAGLVLYFQGGWLTWLFLGTESTPVAQLTIALLKIVAVAMPPFALVSVLNGALRGAGDTRMPLAITFIGYLLVRIPGAYFLAWDVIQLPVLGVTLPGLGWGVTGAWIAMIADTVVRSILVYWRFQHDGWTRLRV
jgi:putative MATE family efflux protein